jgi:hypothetical protein
VVLEVSEGDLRYVTKGQSGRLVFPGIADRHFLVSLTAVTSVASVIDGQNTFRVEASIGDTGDAVRPGMEGIAKIVIEKRPLLWIWSRGLIDWLKYFLWKWVP